MTTEEKIYRRLKAAGLNDFGVSGAMGNLFAESGLRSDNLQNSFEKKLGYTDVSYTAAVDSGTYTGFVRDGAGTVFASGPTGAASKTCWPSPRLRRSRSATAICSSTFS